MKNNGYTHRREKDSRIEKNMQRHLDQLYRENNIKTERVTDVDLQRRGVDIFHIDGNKKYYADEKSASTYYYKKLDTFAFELQCSVNKDNSGWFCQNPYYLTEYYFIAYPYAPGNNDDLKTLDELELLVISKKDMWDYLNSIGYNSAKDILNEFCEKGHVCYHNGRETKRMQINADVKVVQSLYIKPEQPTNIIFSKKLLKKLATKYIIKKFS